VRAAQGEVLGHHVAVADEVVLFEGASTTSRALMTTTSHR
jgi:hypothetical protein